MEHKKDPADITADAYFDLQMKREKHEKHEKGLNRFFLILLFTFILALGVLIFMLPTSDFSEDENRALAPFPSFSLESLASGEFTAGVQKFYADQFPFRNIFVGIKAATELSQIKLENNGVILGSGGYLIKNITYDDYSVADKNLEAIKEFCSNMSDVGIDTSVLIAPRSVDVLSGRIHPAFGYERSNTIWEHIESSGIDPIDLRVLLSGKDSDGEAVFYKTDHHWTTLGAFYAYQELSASLGYTPNNREHYKIETATETFLGTSYSSSGIKWASPDRIDLFRHEGDGEFVTEILDTGEKFDGFYRHEALQGKDKYLVFLGGNYAHVRITREGVGERERLLIIKDSYANALIPFLAEHFDLEIIDPRYYRQPLSELIPTLDIDRALILVNADTLATASELNRIKR